MRLKFSQALLSSTFILALGVAMWLAFAVPLSMLGQFGWWSLPLGLIGGAVLYGLVYLLTDLIWMRLQSMQDLMKHLSELFQDFSWPAIFAISIMAGVGEELLVRGVLQNLAVGYLGPVLGILAASLLFGFMHYLSLTYIVVTFGLGLVFGVVYHLTDSLLLVMAAHAVYDVFAFALLVKYPQAFGIERNES